MAEKNNKFFVFNGKNALIQLLDQHIELETKLFKNIKTNFASRDLIET